MKKSEQTKAKLVEAVINLTNVGQKISVASISKEAKTAYEQALTYKKNYADAHYNMAFCLQKSDKFDEAMGHCLDSIDMDVPLLNSPHFCKKVYYYLNPIDEVKC